MSNPAPIPQSLPPSPGQVATTPQPLNGEEMAQLLISMELAGYIAKEWIGTDGSRLTALDRVAKNPPPPVVSSRWVFLDQAVRERLRPLVVGSIARQIADYSNPSAAYLFAGVGLKACPAWYQDVYASALPSAEAYLRDREAKTDCLVALYVGFLSDMTLRALAEKYAAHVNLKSPNFKCYEPKA